MRRIAALIAAVSFGAPAGVAAAANTHEDSILRPAVDERRGPGGARFYDPPRRLISGPAGSIVWWRPSAPLVALKEASRTITVLYRSRAIDGGRAVMSASIAFPASRPDGPWQTVVWNHVTTGAAESCAPTRSRPDSPELEKMTRGDPTVTALLEAGHAVVRPDYEGVGTPGPHPYLIGDSLARSSVDAMRAARDADPGIGRRWVVAGHSEGGHGSLFTAELGARAIEGLELRGVVAMAPPTHMRQLFELGETVPVTGPGIDQLSALAGLILYGAAAADPELARIYAAGGLSPEALALFPDLEERCFLALSEADSWGGLAPADIPGPRAAALRPVLYDLLDRNDPLSVRLPEGMAVRIDQGVSDPVVPVAFTERLVATLRERGAKVTYARYATATHQSITAADQAAGPAAEWITERLGG